MRLPVDAYAWLLEGWMDDFLHPGTRANRRYRQQERAVKRKRSRANRKKQRKHAKKFKK